MSRRPITTARKVAIFMAAGGICHICGGKIAGKDWDAEHVIPLALGGADDDSNLRPAHKGCHKGKTRVDAASWAKAKRLEARRLGIKPKSRFACARDGKYKQKIGGKIEVRT